MCSGSNANYNGGMIGAVSWTRRTRELLYSAAGVRARIIFVAAKRGGGPGAAISGIKPIRAEADCAGGTGEGEREGGEEADARADRVGQAGSVGSAEARRGGRGARAAGADL